MRKNAAKIAALMLGAAMALTACGGGQSTGMVGETPVPEVMQVLEAVLRQRKVIRMQLRIW